MDGAEQKSYGKEAVLERLSSRRVKKERDAFVTALLLDGVVLLLAVFSIVSAFTAETRDAAMPGVAGAVVGSPALFAISRFVRSRPTPLGWAWLALSALSLAWLLATEVFF